MFSQRTSWSLTANVLTQTRAEVERSGPVIDLTVSNPTVCGLHEHGDELLAALKDPAGMTYEPFSRGLLSARRSLAQYYGRQGIAVDPEHIVLTASTSEAYAFVFRLLADAGDRIAFPRPSYPLFDFLAGLNDVELADYALRFDGRWSVDFEQLSGVLRGVKALALVNPNNPTGSYITSRELKRINSLCAGRGVALISDEVFQEFTLDGQPDKVTLAGNPDVLTFTLGGLSKTLALPQMKLSWILVSGPPAQREDALARLEVIADTYLSVNTPVQQALGRWLELQPRIHDAVSRRIKDNLAALRQAFGPSVLPAEGGWYAVIRLPESRSEEEWIMTWLTEDRVFVHPGYFFDFNEEPFAVVSLLPEPPQFKDGVTRMAKRTMTLNPKP